MWSYFQEDSDVPFQSEYSPYIASYIYAPVILPFAVKRVSVQNLMFSIDKEQVSPFAESFLHILGLLDVRLFKIPMQDKTDDLPHKLARYLSIFSVLTKSGERSFPFFMSLSACFRIF